MHNATKCNHSFIFDQIASVTSLTSVYSQLHAHLASESLIASFALIISNIGLVTILFLYLPQDP